MKAEDRLRKYDEIEAEYGISLIVIHKALKNGVYKLYDKGEYEKVDAKDLFFSQGKLYERCGGYDLGGGYSRRNIELEPKDYGKTWCLEWEGLA